MKRLTRRDENTGQVYAMSDKQSILDKLCLYEEAEERGKTDAEADLPDFFKSGRGNP